jgi:DNA-binding transcriptional MerR regulator
MRYSSPEYMATQLNRKRAYEPPTIPDRLYFKIGDVAELCGVETYVLRFWESQFPQLKPNKSGTGQRLYRRRDVEMAMEIKRLVHAEGYTLSGARAVLGHENRRPDRSKKPDAQTPLPLAAGEGKQLDAVAAPSATPAPSCARLRAAWLRGAAAVPPPQPPCSDSRRVRLALSVVTSRS